MALTLKNITREDIKELDFIRDCKLPKLPEKRFVAQDKGKSKYYVFYNNGLPIGHIDIIVKSRRKYHEYPLICDFFVKESERGKGIGKKILLLIEKEIKKQGFKYLSLDVETKEKGLFKFYSDAGYKFYSGPHKQVSIEEDNKNKKIYVSIYHLRKKL